MNARARRAAGAFAIGFYLIAYIALAIELRARLPFTAWWAELLFYAVAGVAWVFPLRPLMRWMSRPDPNDES